MGGRQLSKRGGRGTHAGWGGNGPFRTGIRRAAVLHGPVPPSGQMTFRAVASAPKFVAPYRNVNGVPSCSMNIHVPGIVATAALLSVTPPTLSAFEKSAPSR